MFFFSKRTEQQILGTVDIDGKNFKRLTFFENGEQVYNPKFSPDDSYIVFDYSYEHTRDIAKVTLTVVILNFLSQQKMMKEILSFDKNGNLIYSSDETGIYQSL